VTWTSFDARKKTDSTVVQPEHGECYSNTVQISESLLRCAVAEYSSVDAS
jgi:hypothetical protein